MRYTLSSIKMPLIVKTIGEQKLEGVLVCTITSGVSVHLFFRKGLLVHICGEKPDQSSDEMLHELFGAEAFELEWQPWAVRLAQSNIALETRQAFMDVLQILTQNGNFEAPETSRLDLTFFSTSVPTKRLPVLGEEEVFTPAPVLEKALKGFALRLGTSELGPVELQVVAPTPSQPKVAVASKPPIASAVYFIEANLLLPPGQPQDQLEDLLREVSLKEQLESLTRAHFTGYVYYQISAGVNPSQPGDFGLVLFNGGNISDIVCVTGQKGLKQTGAAAYKALIGLRLTPIICKVETRILKAYRALVSCEKPQQNIKATKANLAGLFNAFKQSGQDGLVILYLDSLKLHYFLLFEGGTQVGVFGPEAKTGHLQLLTAPLALPAVDTNATMTLMLAGKSGKPLAAKATTLLAMPKQPLLADNAFNLEIPPTEAVSWQGMLGQLSDGANDFDRATVRLPASGSTKSFFSSKNEDVPNPYDF